MCCEVCPELIDLLLVLIDLFLDLFLVLKDNLVNVVNLNLKGENFICNLFYSVLKGFLS